MQAFEPKARSLRTHLLVYALAIVVPLLALAGVILYRVAVAERQLLEQHLTQTAQDLTDDIDQEMSRRIVGVAPLP